MLFSYRVSSATELSEEQSESNESESSSCSYQSIRQNQVTIKKYPISHYY